ncbi:MAG: hypothetical protein M3R15_15500 [Acidobacteriota bacterium]|nr:hypothetical protein [Acidobacteriota bacterium]
MKHKMAFPIALNSRLLKRFTLRTAVCFLLMICPGLLISADAGEARAQTQGTIQTIMVRFRGVDRPVSLFVPTSYGSGTPIPLLFALHGGSGDASIMYDPNKHITEYAESEGFIAVFPNGLPRPGAPPNSTNYYWEDPANKPYMSHLIDLMQDTFTVDTARIYFVGFSGGAKLIYGLTADPQISARIAAVATVAGEIGGKSTEPMTSQWEVIDPSISGGVPMSALLLQGGSDQRMPEQGGFDDDFEKIASSFQMKVDIWRLFINARTGSSVTLLGAPPRVEATRYTNPTTGDTVISATDPVLAHRWPEWNYMGAIWDFFEYAPTRQARKRK